MDTCEYSTLLDALTAVPDPRHARGQHLEWSLILGVIASAILSQQRSAAALAHWVHAHAAVLLAAFQPARGRLPSEATLRRALRQVDVTHLEQCLSRLRPVPVPGASAATPSALHGYAIDGKYVRGAGVHGCPTFLVSMVRHHHGTVVAQTRVPSAQHERTGVREILLGQDLHGKVITRDAGLAHPALAAQIRAQGGHYFMVVKRNQARLYQELTWYFATPPLLCDQPWRSAQTMTKGHGRLELRRITCTDDLDGYLQWPDVQQVVQRICERTLRKTGVPSEAVTYGLTSLPAADATAADLATLWRGHWTIENRVHYVRDVTMGEDAHQMYTGNAPQALAALRNAWLNVLRALGWTNMAAALRHYSWSLTDALQVLGVTALRL
jgi:predicted transposase YbfD/YdcC